MTKVTRMSMLSIVQMVRRIRMSVGWSTSSRQILQIFHKHFFLHFPLVPSLSKLSRFLHSTLPELKQKDRRLEIPEAYLQAEDIRLPYPSGGEDPKCTHFIGHLDPREAQNNTFTSRFNVSHVLLTKFLFLTRSFCTFRCFDRFPDQKKCCD